MDNLKEQFQSLKLSKEKKDDIVRTIEKGERPSVNNSYRSIKFVVPAFVALLVFCIYLQLGTTPLMSQPESFSTANEAFHQNVSILSKGAFFTYIFTILTFLLSSYYLYVSIHSVERWHKRFWLNEIRAKMTVRRFIMLVVVVLALYATGSIALIESAIYRELTFVLVIIYFFWVGTAYQSRTIDKVCCEACHKPIKSYQYFKSGKDFKCKYCSHSNQWPRKQQSTAILLFMLPVFVNGMARFFDLHVNMLILLILLLIGFGYLYILPFAIDNQYKLPAFQDVNSVSTLQATFSIICVLCCVGLFFLLRGPEIDLIRAALATLFLGSAGAAFAIFSAFKQKKNILAYVALILNGFCIVCGLLLIMANGMSM